MKRTRDPLQALDDLEVSSARELESALGAITELDAQRRGIYLEKLMVCLLKMGRVTAELNPSAVPGRQTDFTFTTGGCFFIAEAKWLHRAVGKGEADGLHQRLSRSQPGTIGCFVSMSGFTSDLLDDLSTHREHEFVLVNGDEIHAAIDGEIDFSELVKRKREATRLRGQFWFWPDKSPTISALPSTSFSPYALGAHEKIPRIVSHVRGLADLHFMVEHENIETFLPTSVLELRPSLPSVNGLMGLLTRLHRNLDIGDDGAFSIHQAEASWFGFGAKDLVTELRERDRRYREAPWMKYIHHSESFFFSANTSAGFLTIAGRQHARDAAEPYEATVEIVADGIPLDHGILMATAREVDPGAAHLRIELPPDHQKLRSREIDPGDVILEPIALIRTGQLHGFDGIDVLGIVVKNPFYSKPQAKRQKEGGFRASELAELEHIPCRLRSAHALGDKVGAYRLLSIKTLHLGGLEILRVMADWDEIIESAPAGTDIAPRTPRARRRRRPS